VGGKRKPLVFTQRNYYFRAQNRCTDSHHAHAGAALELPTHHRVPLGWLLEHGNESIRMRVYQDLVTPGAVPPETLEAAEQAVAASKPVQAIVRKQKDNGVWGGNLLGLAASARDGIKDVGTIPQHRRLLELGYPRSGRPFKLSERILFRILSRDDDPFLEFEFAKLAKAGIVAAEWARNHMREAAAGTLAEAGYMDDPRIRGAAHRVATEVSQFLRSPAAEKPFVRSGAKYILDPAAYPPTWYSVAMMAAMPNLQRERAAFTERLGQYLASPATKRKFSVVIEKKVVKADYLLLGDPVESDARGNPKDIPLALYFLELMARIGALPAAPHAVKVLNRLLADCDDRGVWRPAGLKALPRAASKVTYHWYPLQPDGKTAESRLVDVTFRLALIAKHLGWQLEYV
jgi:hypothetical protein